MRYAKPPPKRTSCLAMGRPTSQRCTRATLDVSVLFAPNPFLLGGNDSAATHLRAWARIDQHIMGDRRRSWKDGALAAATSSRQLWLAITFFACAASNARHTSCGGSGPMTPVIAKHARTKTRRSMQRRSEFQRSTRQHGRDEKTKMPTRKNAQRRSQQTKSRTKEHPPAHETGKPPHHKWFSRGFGSCSTPTYQVPPKL